MEEEKDVCLMNNQQKDVCLMMNQQKDVCFGMIEEEESVLSPGSRMDIAEYEIWGCGTVQYNARLLPEMVWWVFSSFPPFCLFNSFVAFPLNLDIVFCVLGVIFYITLQCAALLYPVLKDYRYGHRTPIRSVGPEGKFAIDFIPALIAAALHHSLNFNNYDGLLQFLDLNCGYLFLLLGCTSYLYVILHFMRTAYDITGKDVILGLAMQTLCFMVHGGFLVRAVAFIFCFALCFYRYMTYSAPPALPPRPKMESDIPTC